MSYRYRFVMSTHRHGSWGGGGARKTGEEKKGQGERQEEEEEEEACRGRRRPAQIDHARFYWFLGEEFPRGYSEHAWISPLHHRSFHLSCDMFARVCWLLVSIFNPDIV